MADLQETLGTIIRRARRECRLTLRELAHKAALSVVYLGEIERGKKYPSARVLEELARALDLDVSDLLDLVVQELRADRPQVLTAPIGFVPAPAKDSTPRAALEPQMSVFAPAEVAILAIVGTACGPQICDATPQRQGWVPMVASR
jgi:transcriptional regulator with XRE-family HTH domain